MARDLPEWLNDRRIADELSANAYEAIPGHFRAGLKTAIALATFKFGHNSQSVHARIEQEHAGFWQISHSRPRQWAILVFTDKYAAAARLCAAAILPALAGVQTVAAICVGGSPTPQALLALELCGVEDIFCLKHQEICRLMADIAQMRAAAKGAIVLLHNGELEKPAHMAARTGLPCYEENTEPTLLVHDPESFAVDLIEFAHGHEIRPLPCNASPYAVYCDSAQAREVLENNRSASLVLAPGCECFWLHPRLDLNFFRSERAAFGFLENDDED